MLKAKFRKQKTHKSNGYDPIAASRKAKNGDKFIALYDNGDISGYSSESEADLALCNALAFFTGGNEAEIDRLFRQSKLYREKWEREDYREATIQKAVLGCNGRFFKGTIGSFARKKAQLLVERHQLSLLINLRKI